MKAAVTLLLIGVLIAITGCSSGEGNFRAGYDFTSIEKIAVVEVTGYFKQEGVRNQIASFVEMELLKRGYAPIERTRIQALLDEQEFQTSEITTPNEAVSAGKILNVPVVIVVDIPKFGDDIALTAKMLDVEDGSILWVGSGTGKTGTLFTTVLVATAGAVIGGSVDSDNTATGAVIGGVLGGAAGYALSPQVAERVKDVIAKMCDTMPDRFQPK